MIKFKLKILRIFYNLPTTYFHIHNLTLMLFIVLAILIFITLCVIIRRILPTSKGDFSKTVPQYMNRPAHIYYPKQKIESDITKATVAEYSLKITKSYNYKAKLATISDLSQTRKNDEFRHPSQADHNKVVSNSKLKFAIEKKQIERTSISEHDEKVYQEAEQLRLERESRFVEEKNRRWFAQKEFERRNKQ